MRERKIAQGKKLFWKKRSEKYKWNGAARNDKKIVKEKKSHSGHAHASMTTALAAENEGNVDPLLMISFSPTTKPVIQFSTQQTPAVLSFVVTSSR